MGQSVANCLSCGNEFTKTRGGQRYCCKRCAMDAYNKRRSDKTVLGDRICLWCGKQITEGRTSRNYCCKACRVAASRDRRRKSITFNPRTCPVCGVVFTHHTGSQVYCSKECHAKAMRVSYDAAVCPICGKSFVPHNGFQKYCSKDCNRLAANKAKYDKHDHSPRICKLCGKSFMPHNGFQRYCSVDCFNESRRLKKPEYTRRYEAKPETAARKRAYYNRPDVKARVARKNKEWADAHMDIVRETKKRYSASAKGKAARARFQKTEKYFAGRHRKDVKRRYRKHNNGEFRYDKGICWQNLVKRTGSMVCVSCGITCDPNSPDKCVHPTVDHIKSLFRGGTHTWDNVQLMCMRCNAGKGCKQ